MTHQMLVRMATESGCNGSDEGQDAEYHENRGGSHPDQPTRQPGSGYEDDAPLRRSTQRPRNPWFDLFNELLGCGHRATLPPATPSIVPTSALAADEALEQHGDCKELRILEEELTRLDSETLDHATPSLSMDGLCGNDQRAACRLLAYRYAPPSMTAASTTALTLATSKPALLLDASGVSRARMPMPGPWSSAMPPTGGSGVDVGAGVGVQVGNVPSETNSTRVLLVSSLSATSFEKSASAV